jgi:hypothetical protein
MTRRQAVALALAAVAWAPAARATITDIAWSPPSQNGLPTGGQPSAGEAVSYWGVDDGNPPPSQATSYQFDRQYTSGGYTAPWQLGAPGNIPGGVFIEAIPGTYNLRLTVNYVPVLTGWDFTTFPWTSIYVTPAPTVVTKQVTISPPASFRIVRGPDTPVPRFDQVTGALVTLQLVFQVVCANGRDAGPSLGGLAQERITNIWYIGLGIRPGVDWNPLPGQDNTDFKLSNGQIFDLKTFSNDAATWDSWPNGTVFMTAHQDLRIMWVDPCGNTQYSYIGGLDFGRYKVDPDNWAIGIGGTYPPPQ